MGKGAASGPSIAESLSRFGFPEIGIPVAHGSKLFLLGVLEWEATRNQDAWMGVMFTVTLGAIKESAPTASERV